MGMHVIGFTGKDGVCKIEHICDICVEAPSRVTPRIQEGHMLLGHIVCELVEAEMFGKV